MAWATRTSVFPLHLRGRRARGARHGCGHGRAASSLRPPRIHAQAAKHQTAPTATAARPRRGTNVPPPQAPPVRATCRRNPSPEPVVRAWIQPCCGVQSAAAAAQPEVLPPATHAAGTGSRLGCVCLLCAHVCCGSPCACPAGDSAFGSGSSAMPSTPRASNRRRSKPIAKHKAIQRIMNESVAPYVANQRCTPQLQTATHFLRGRAGWCLQRQIPEWAHATGIRWLRPRPRPPCILATLLQCWRWPLQLRQR